MLKSIINHKTNTLLLFAFASLFENSSIAATASENEAIPLQLLAPTGLSTDEYHVYIDNKSVGNLPLNYQIPKGNHRVVIERYGYQPKSFTITASSNNGITLSIPELVPHSWFPRAARSPRAPGFTQEPINYWIGAICNLAALSFHENITELALKRAGLILPHDGFKSVSALSYIIGVRWNDDPEYILPFPNDDNCAMKGLSLHQRMSTSDTITFESHNGQWQFLHAMASSKSESQNTTKDRILLWIELMYKVSTRQIPATSRMDAHGILKEMQKYLPPKATIGDLLRAQNTSEMASGVLLHTIQDSYSPSHTKRQIHNGRYSKIQTFYSYQDQSSIFHSLHEGPHICLRCTNYEQVIQTSGGMDALTQSAQLLTFIRENKSWDIVREYISTHILELESPQ